MTHNLNSRRKAYFKEIQHLNNLIKWIITLIPLGTLGYLFYYVYQQYLQENSILGFSKEFKLTVIGVFALTLLIIALIVLIWQYHLVVKVSGSGLYYKHPPIKNKYKKIHASKITDVKIAHTDNLPKHTIKIKIKGNEGVLIKLEDGRNIFIGSLHNESLKKAVMKLIA